MASAKRKFGIELETVGLGVEDASLALFDDLGGTSRAGSSGDYKVKLKGLGAWIVAHDGSLPHPAAEVVSPPLPATKVKSVQTVARTLQENGALASPGEMCASHVHVSGKDLTVPQILSLLRYYIAIEAPLFYFFCSTKRREYAKLFPGHFKKHVAHLRGTPSLDALQDLWYGDLDGQGASDSKFDPSRYHGLNLHSLFMPRATVELRIFDGTLDEDVLALYIKLSIALVEVGSVSPPPVVKSLDDFLAVMDALGVRALFEKVFQVPAASASKLLIKASLGGLKTTLDEMSYKRPQLKTTSFDLDVKSAYLSKQLRLVSWIQLMIKLSDEFTYDDTITLINSWSYSSAEQMIGPLMRSKLDSSALVAAGAMNMLEHMNHHPAFMDVMMHFAQGRNIDLSTSTWSSLQKSEQNFVLFTRDAFREYTSSNGPYPFYMNVHDLVRLLPGSSPSHEEKLSYFWRGLYAKALEALPDTYPTFSPIRGELDDLRKRLLHGPEAGPGSFESLDKKLETISSALAAEIKSLKDQLSKMEEDLRALQIAEDNLTRAILGHAARRNDGSSWNRPSMLDPLGTYRPHGGMSSEAEFSRVFDEAAAGLDQDES